MILDHHEVLKVVKIFFPRSGGSKNSKKKNFFFFSIFNVKYFFNKRTVTSTFRNPVKYSWNSTGKARKKNFLGFILQDMPWNHKNGRNCYFAGYFRDLGTNVEFHCFLWFCEFLKVSAYIFWLKTVLALS